MYEYDTSLIFFPLGLMKQFLNKKSPDHYEVIIKDFIDLDKAKLDISKYNTILL